MTRPCGKCPGLRDQVRRLERDYDNVAEASLRLALWVKQRGLPLPGSQELRQRFPLDHYGR